MQLFVEEVTKLPDNFMPQGSLGEPFYWKRGGRMSKLMHN
jgi:hypothetical protein